MSTDEKGKKHKALKVIGIILGVVIVLGVGAYFFLMTHTQIIVGSIQKKLYGDTPVNSFEAPTTPVNGMQENGQYLISEIEYDTEYPNSFLNILYKDDNFDEDRPTFVYFHGGGFYGGSKSTGDPMAENETIMLEDICAAGYNIVSVDYALVPDYHFPVPLIQANRAFDYIISHKDEYHLNTDNIVIMGSSAGAIMTSQLGSIITDPEYAALVGVAPSLAPEQVSAIVLDDAPLDYEDFDIFTKVLIGNYVNGSVFLSKDEISRYNNILHVTEKYPPTFLLGSKYRHDMNEMHTELENAGVENVLVDPFAEVGEEKPHCFVSLERSDAVAKDAFDRLLDFLKEKTKVK